MILFDLTMTNLEKTENRGIPLNLCDPGDLPAEIRQQINDTMDHMLTPEERVALREGLMATPKDPGDFNESEISGLRKLRNRILSQEPKI